MTVEDLLKQLNDERENAWTAVWIYGAKELDAMIHDNHDDEETFKRIHDENYKKVELLGTIIKEIKKRVS
jgi:hypothetical protein